MCPKSQRFEKKSIKIYKGIQRPISKNKKKINWDQKKLRLKN